MTTTTQLAGIVLGDERGLEVDWCGPGDRQTARLDPRRSLVAVGTVGSGKTCLARGLARRLLDDGGRVVAVERGTGEHVEAPGPFRHSQVVDPMAGANLDPLRLFAGDEALEHAATVLSMLAGVSDAPWYTRTASALAVGVGRAVAEGAGTLAEVTSALEASPDHDAHQIGVQVGALFSSGLLPFLVEGETPALDADYVCVWLQPAWPGQPLRDEVLTYLAIAFGRHAVCADARPAALVLDGVPISTSAASVVVGALRGGRAANAATWVLSPRLDALPPVLVDALAALGANRLVLPRSLSDEVPALARFAGLGAWMAEQLAAAGEPVGAGFSDAELGEAMRWAGEQGLAVWRHCSGRVGVVRLPYVAPGDRGPGPGLFGHGLEAVAPRRSQ